MCEPERIYGLEDMGLNVFQGSNDWAVSSRRSSTGKPVLCNDTHMTLNVPGIWYQMHQVIPGKLNVSGAALPGQPFIFIGHNQLIAWRLAYTLADNVDFYEEKIKDDDFMQYLSGKESTRIWFMPTCTETSDYILQRVFP